MAGHSHWAGIKHKKGKADKLRSKIFSKLSKEITVAAKLGDKDPEMNPRLRSAVQAARSANMPKDNIERAIKKGEGNDPDSNYEEVRYEGYGPAGVAIIVEALTNNKNRTAAEIRSCFSKHGGNLGETGSVSFGFRRLGCINLNKDLVDEEDLFDFVLANGSQDYEINNDEYSIFCDQNILHDLSEKISKKYGKINQASLIWKSENTISIEKDNADKLFKLLNVLEESDDVQFVSSNFEVSDEVLSSLTV